MTNAKVEFVLETVGRRVKCAIIESSEYHTPTFKHKLRVGYHSDEYDQFLDRINFDYDSGYGGQEVYGVIWYTDGTWSERYEYDGSEHWVHKECPEIDKELL
jgi:hypothetical protein